MNTNWQFDETNLDHQILIKNCTKQTGAFSLLETCRRRDIALQNERNPKKIDMAKAIFDSFMAEQD